MWFVGSCRTALPETSSVLFVCVCVMVWLGAYNTQQPLRYNGKAAAALRLFAGLPLLQLPSVVGSFLLVPLAARSISSFYLSFAVLTFRVNDPSWLFNRITSSSLSFTLALHSVATFLSFCVLQSVVIKYAWPFHRLSLKFSEYLTYIIWLYIGGPIHPFHLLSTFILFIFLSRNNIALWNYLTKIKYTI